jgi:hypothetical protein
VIPNNSSINFFSNIPPLYPIPNPKEIAE